MRDVLLPLNRPSPTCADTVCLQPACMAQGLAKSVAWDGEGATCLIEVGARGAADDAGARAVARAVAASSLVKAAIFGHDPNWGRIACAAGCARKVFVRRRAG